jgi:sugar lactone lactonase YvrE
MSRARDFADIISSGVLADGQVSFAEITGVTATASEINYLSGVTSDVQTQLDAKVGTNYTGDVNITGELLVDSYNETFKKVSSVGTVTGYQLASAAYASKSFSVASQETAPRAVEFKPDGTKMYVVGSNSDSVHQYALSTAWDVSTASYESKSFSVNSEQSVPDGIRFKPDGTKFYITGDTPDSVHQYSMSTAWDISTASYDSVTFSLTGQTTSPMGIVFKPDGTKFYMASNQNDTIFQYALSTAWDLSTASYESKSFSVATQETSPSGINFNADGTKMWVIGFGTDAVYQYSLSTAWDVSTASYDSVSFSVATQTITPYDFTFGDSGTKFYVTEVTSDSIYQYDFSATLYSTTFDCENANVFETVLDASTTVVFSDPPASGTPVTTGYNLSGATFVDSFSILSQEGVVEDITFNANGTKMFIVGSNGDEVNEYALSTGFDVSTASFTQNFSVSSQDTNPTAIAFNSDGTKMFIVGNANDTVYQYGLTTGFDISTASYSSTSFSLSSQENNPKGLAFNSDGTKMFVAGESGDDVNEYTLSTGFDVSTASYSQNFSVASQDSNPTGLFFTSDGTRMYITGNTSESVYEYTLTTGFDVSTASYSSNSFDVGTAEETAPRGVAFNSNGTKMFVVGPAGDDVNEYTTEFSSLNDSTAYAMSLKVVQDSGASGYTVTWPTSVDWPSATAPTLTATASAVDQFVFYTYDGGTTWYGFTAGQALG